MQASYLSVIVLWAVVVSTARIRPTPPYSNGKPGEALMHYFRATDIGLIDCSFADTKWQAPVKPNLRFSPFQLLTSRSSHCPTVR